jgi:hypothetical protein
MTSGFPGRRPTGWHRTGADTVMQTHGFCVRKPAIAAAFPADYSCMPERTAG